MLKSAEDPAEDDWSQWCSSTCLNLLSTSN